MTFANTVVTGVTEDEENLAESMVQDDGCGCCMRDIEKHEIKTLRSAISDMRDMAEKAEKVLEAREKLFEEVGSRLSRKKAAELECGDCGSGFSRILGNDFFSVYGEALCEDCVDKREKLYTDRGVVLKKVNTE